MRWIFLPQFGLNAVAHGNDLLDLVAAHFLHVAHVQKAHVHIALGQLVAQHVLYLRELKLGVADHGDFFVLDLDAGARAFKVKAGGDFLDGVFHSVFYINQIGFADGVKSGHGVVLGALKFGGAPGADATIRRC
jgi:hypothetical protein